MQTSDQAAGAAGSTHPRHGSRELAYAVLLALATAAPWPAAAAQQGAVSAGTNDEASSAPVTLGTVIVTADRRRQPAREIPMHVTVVTAKQLQRQGARDLNEYVSTQPNVVFTNAGGPGQGMLIMRGVSTGNQTSSTVSEYIDDVPVGGSTVYASSGSFVFDPALLDLRRIEFLYGPQGTLYGAGSMGGLVKFVTFKPDVSRFYGNVGFGISDTQHGGVNYREQAMLNAPLKQDKVALRASVVDEHQAGLYDAVGTLAHRHVDRNHTKGARVQLQMYPSNHLSINLSAMTQTIHQRGMSMADYDLSGQPMSRGPWNRALNHAEPYSQKFNLFALHADYALPWATLQWTSAYQKFDNQGIQDYPNGFLDLLNEFGPIFGVFQPLQSLYVDSDYDVHKSSQEIRIVSRPHQYIDWLAGVWLTREDVWQHFVLEGENVPPPAGITALLLQQMESRYDEYAVYGDVTWHPTPAFNVTGGIRVSGNKQILRSFEDGPVAGSPGGFREHTNDSDTTGLLTAKYRLTKGQLLYFRGASGYRPGGLQSPVTATIIGSNPDAKDSFGSDSLRSYELGYKANWLGGNLAFNADVYHIDWKHMQLYTFLLGNGIVENSGNARIDGAETSASWHTGPWLLTAAATWNDARTTQVDPLGDIPKGAQLPYSARRTAVVSARYAWRMGGDPARVSAVFRASSRRNAGFTGDTSDPNFPLPGYAMLDLDAGVTLGGGRGVDIDVFLRNALDRHVPIGTLNSETINFLSSLGGPMLVHLSEPRTVGINVTVPFGSTPED